MLKEHLRGDNLWKILARRDKIFSTNQDNRIDLQLRVVEILEEQTGYKMAEGSINTGPFLYSSTTGDLFYNSTLNWAFGDYNTDWQNKIIADKKTGTIRYLDFVLAEIPGKEETCLKNLLEAYNKMKVLPEAARVVASYWDLQEVTVKVRRMLEEILALGLIPGQCRVCRRLGI